MPRTTANPDQTAAHYTRNAVPGEAANRRSKASRSQAGASTQPNRTPNQTKEITMFRTISGIAVLALTVATAQADTLSTRIQHAAETACAPERASGSLPVSHYGAIYQQCVYRLSASTLTRVQDAQASSHKLASN